MITTPVDYLSLLYLLQDQNKQYVAITLPKDETIYNIDLNKRTVEAPEYLSVAYDHNAETIYFKVDRYFDLIDLARDDIYIVVQYENANTKEPKKRGFIYAPPFIDTTTYADENKILFPWVIEGPATAYAGTVTFSIKFYRLNAKGQYEFNLNTQTSKSKVLHGMEVYSTTENYTYEAPTVEAIYQRIAEVEKANELFWIDADPEVYIKQNVVYISIPITKYYINNEEVEMEEGYRVYLNNNSKELKIDIDTSHILSDKYEIQWYVSGRKIDGANNLSYTVNEPGFYYVLVSNTYNGVITRTPSDSFNVKY